MYHSPPTTPEQQLPTSSHTTSAKPQWLGISTLIE